MSKVYIFILMKGDLYIENERFSFLVYTYMYGNNYKEIRD